MNPLPLSVPPYRQLMSQEAFLQLMPGAYLQPKVRWAENAIQGVVAAHGPAWSPESEVDEDYMRGLVMRHCL